jgi:GTP cyclohydrolase I
MSEYSKDTAEWHVHHILQSIGENPDRDGLKDTPKRVIKSYKEIFSGYSQDPEKMLTVFDNDGEYGSMVVLRDIEIYSVCEHHMLPFFGKAHVAYIPDNGKIVGISKLARVVDAYARRLQVQERIGEQVTNLLMKALKPKGAACIIEATHMCMLMRGVGKQNSVMVTSSLKGEFMEDLAVREELMKLIGK